MATEVRAFTNCRNERLRLPAFLSHYRRLGVTNFCIAENGSTDGSAEYLAEQSDVRVCPQPGTFKESRDGTVWLNSMLDEFAEAGWSLAVDVDELLCYPGSESTPLPVLADYLDRGGFDAFACLLLDVYPPTRLRDCRYAAGEDLFSVQPHFDPGPYRRSRTDLCPGTIIRGGMRERMFYPEFRGPWTAAWIASRLRRQKPPCLTKVPLVRWGVGSRYLHVTHFVSPKRVAPETGALLHFKFLADFHDRARAESERGEYYDGATEYRRYAAILDRDPETSFMYEDSIQYESTGQLVRLGLMRDSAGWAVARAPRGVSPAVGIDQSRPA